MVGDGVLIRICLVLNVEARFKAGFFISCFWRQLLVLGS